ncbi:MAG: GPR endopeptidase [Clostridia bacterium]
MSIRTDLALEAREMHGELEGVSEEKRNETGIEITRITVLNEEAAKKLEKAVGQYITIDAPILEDRTSDAYESLAKVISSELTFLMGDISKTANILVVGLGNRFVTPDSLGPRVLDSIYVTRHIKEHIPELSSPDMRPVCAVSPGVLGVTGVETFEIIKGLCDRIKPELVIAIDALASRRAARISTTVQLSDAGISPGSGVGNMQKGLNFESLGVKVIAIGVPLVVHASTISQDTISLIAEETGMHNDEEKLLGLAQKVIDEHIGPLIVTPKEIDGIVSDMAKILANGINFALFGEKTVEIGEMVM